MTAPLSPQDYLRTQWDFFWWIAPLLIFVFVFECIVIGLTSNKDL